jgi:hypothetical protein
MTHLIHCYEVPHGRDPLNPGDNVPTFDAFESPELLDSSMLRDSTSSLIILLGGEGVDGTLAFTKSQF